MENIKTLDVVEGNEHLANGVLADGSSILDAGIEVKQDETDIGGEGLVEEAVTVH